MITSSTAPPPGFYRYTYPTFVDKPQYICVHFLTPDGQQAFVSYPYDRARRAASLVTIDWFQSVTLCLLEGQPQLMSLLTKLLTRELNDCCIKMESDQRPPTSPTGHKFGQQFVA